MGLDLLAPPKRIAGVQSKHADATMQSIGISRRQIIHRPVPGQDAAMDVLRSFLSSRGESYRWSMSSPSLAVDNCSRLAPYFSTGCISVRRVVQTTSAKMRRLKEARSRGEDVGLASEPLILSESARLALSLYAETRDGTNPGHSCSEPPDR